MDREELASAIMVGFPWRGVLPSPTAKTQQRAAMVVGMPALAAFWSPPIVAVTISGMERPSLPGTTVGATVPGYRLTWTDSEGDAIDLSNATLTARRLNLATGTAVAATGVLTIATPTGGVFNWYPSATDVLVAGVFLMEFTAALNGGAIAKCAAFWPVREAVVVL